MSIFQNFKVLTRLSATLTVVIFLLAMFATLSMNHEYQGSASCASATGLRHATEQSQSVCPMDTLGHLTWWSNAFLGLTGSGQSLNVLTALGSLLMLAFLLSYLWVGRLPAIGLWHASKDPPENKDYNFFTQFLAAGKAQPLLYA